MYEKDLLRGKFETIDISAGATPSKRQVSAACDADSAGRYYRAQRRAWRGADCPRDEYEALMIEVGELNELGRSEEAKRVAALAANVVMSST